MLVELQSQEIIITPYEEQYNGVFVFSVPDARKVVIVKTF